MVVFLLKKEKKGVTMSQKIFLTSALAMGVIAPAFAEPSHTDSFPNDGYMQEDYTYTNAATSDNMDGVYSGTVNAVAEYDIIDYIVNAGQYLPSDSETVITCPAGSYCPGISGNVQYNQTTPQGIQTCPTGYANSADGASADTDCYRTCTNSDVAHSRGTVNGGYYYGDNNQCVPTDCVNGWHLKPGLNFADTIGYSDYYSNGYIASDGTWQEDSGSSYVERGIDFYDVPENAGWATYYGPEKGFVYGTGKCSTQSGQRARNGQMPSVIENLPDSTGSNCWCKITGYKGSDGILQSLNSYWVFVEMGGISCSTSGCNFRCKVESRYGYDSVDGYREYRSALFGSVTGFQSGPATCEANTITINWSDVDPNYAGQNNEGTATYGSDVRTPFKAQTKKGQTFKGWRFSKPTETNLP